MIELRQISLKFRNSYDKIWSFRDLIKDIAFKDNEDKYIEVLRGVDLQVNEGEILGVIGRNGAGKSTLLKVIAGIYHPDEGEIQVRGTKAILDLNKAYFPELSGYENVLISGMLMGYEKEMILQRMEEIEEFSELKEYFGKPVKTYSTGMISRLGLSLAAIIEVEVLLIDETLSVGDFFFQKKSKRVFSEIISGSKCEVIVSHDMELISEHCTRTIVLNKGIIEFDGLPEDAVKKYTSEEWS